MKAYIEAQGSLLLVKLMGVKSRTSGGSSRRGKIKSFSAKSRLRLLRFMARIRQKNTRATFITLTFKGYPTNEVAKMALHAFLQRIARKFPEASAVWRMEYQRRGSIHFHLLCFNLPYWHWEEILQAWKECSKQHIARIDVRLVKSHRGVMSYVSKYIAKVSSGVRKTFFILVPYQHARRKWKKGRFWGYHNKKALPLGERIQGLLTDSKTIKRLSNAAWEIIGTAKRFGSISFHVFMDHATTIAMRNIEEGGLYLDEWGWSIGTPEPCQDLTHPATERFSEHELAIPRVSALGRASRPRSARSVQPCTRDWLKRASFSVRALSVP